MVLLAGAFSIATAMAQTPDFVPEVMQPRHAPPDGWRADGDVNRGRMLAHGGALHSLRFSCAQCHGADGVADSSGAFPRLAGQGAWYLMTALHNFANGARPSPIMGPVAIELTNEDMADLAAYYASLGVVPYAPTPPAGHELVSKGEAIATKGLADAGVPACQACHGAGGVGQAPLYPYLGGQYEPYLIQQLSDFKSGKRTGDPGGVMRAIASRLSREQIEAVSAYFASQRPQEVMPSELASAPQRKPPAPLPMITGATIKPVAKQDRIVLPGGGGAAAK
jgi:cytochrome c553